MGRDVAKEEDVNVKTTKRLVRDGEFVAEVDVQLVEVEGAGRLIFHSTMRTNSMMFGTPCGQVISSALLNSPAAYIVSHQWKLERAR